MSDRRVHRHVLPADGSWHALDLTGPVLHVDCRRYDEVEVWVLHNEGEQVAQRTFQVFGTGQPLPAEAGQYVGSALSPGGPLSSRGQLVWHVFEGK